MNNFFLIAIVILTCLSSINTTKSQEIYTAQNIDYIFSTGNINYGSKKYISGMRFTAWYNFEESFHINFNNNFGIYTGLGVKNIGIAYSPDSIYFHGAEEEKYYKTAQYTNNNTLTDVKQRIYTLGMPLALKFGNITRGFCFFIGGQYDYSLHYKEKIWINKSKKKYSEWFGNETNTFLPSLFAGVKFPNETIIKIRWYLQNFLNTNHTTNLYNETTKTSTEIKPYENYDTQLFYISVGAIIEKKKPKEKPLDLNPQEINM